MDIATRLSSTFRPFRPALVLAIEGENTDSLTSVLHPGYNIHGTGTGRLSSSSGVKGLGFNNQNVPKGSIGALPILYEAWAQSHPLGALFVWDEISEENKLEIRRFLDENGIAHSSTDPVFTGTWAAPWGLDFHPLPAVTLWRFYGEEGGGFVPEVVDLSDLPLDFTLTAMTDYVQEVPPDVSVVEVRMPWRGRPFFFYRHQEFGFVPRPGDGEAYFPTIEELGGPWDVRHPLPNGDTHWLVYVPGNAEFRRAQDPDKTVATPPGFMGKYTVTVKEWNTFCVVTGRLGVKSLTEMRNSGVYDITNHPVTSLTFDDAYAWAVWARLGIPDPTFWEHAGFGDDDREYPWGSEAPNDELAHTSVVTVKDGTCPVDAHPQGASVYGMNDVVGNVWNWVTTSPVQANGVQYVAGRGWVWSE